MATKTLSNDFMQQIADDTAWRELSGNLSWTEVLLEKYQDKVDWQEVSKNRDILWTVPMLQKFKHRIYWDKLSECADNDVLTENCIEMFKDKWNWTELSNSYHFSVTIELQEKFADYWDWEAIINGCSGDLYSNTNAIEFYERYKEYIPAAKLQNSTLWDIIVKQRERQIMAEITA